MQWVIRLSTYPPLNELSSPLAACALRSARGAPAGDSSTSQTSFLLFSQQQQWRKRALVWGFSLLLTATFLPFSDVALFLCLFCILMGWRGSSNGLYAWALCRYCTRRGAVGAVDFLVWFFSPFFSTLSCLSPAAHSGRNYNFHRLLREQRRHWHRRWAKRTHRIQRPLQPQWSGIWTSHAMINTLCTIVNFFNSHGSLFPAAFLSVLPYSLALPLAGVQRHGECCQHSIR